MLVCYRPNTLVIYRSDRPSRGQVLQTPEGLKNVSSITTDGHLSFIVTDEWNKSLYVLDRAGNLRHRIQPDTRTDSGSLQDCAVVQSQLCLGYAGCITVMSSQ